MLFFIRDWTNEALGELRRSWGWFLALGILFIVLGVVCIVADQIATFATVQFFGWLLLVTAGIAFIHIFTARTWPGTLMHLLSALLRGFTGYLLVRYPSVGAAGLTLVLASLFVVGGLFRAVAAAAIRFPRWGWSVASGTLSLALGALLLLQLPQTSVWFIGFAVGIDALVDGVALVSFALALHRLPLPRGSGFAQAT
jgi:uncharacterized membrane protein HdeD (DUF308 family)